MPNDERPSQGQGSSAPHPVQDGIVASGWLANSSMFGSHDEHRMKRALGASITTIVVYGALFAALFFVARSATRVIANPPEPLKYVVTFLQQPGPGGGGGGSPQPAPPKPIEVPKTRPPDPVPVVPPPPQLVPPPPIPTLTAPIITTNAQAVQATGASSVSLSQYGGGGSGGGIGPGRGDGVGPGTGGNFGGGFYKPGSGVTWPTVLRQPKPNYTPEAMRLKLQGEVTLEAEILADGTVGNVRVKKSLDRVHGLDQEAIRVAKLWLFKPAMDKDGKSVPVVAELIITFNLH
jgi:protein TonB